MGRIQSSIGLVTGTDIVGTVDKLMNISAQPRDRLLARTQTLQQQRTAISELTASVIGVQLSGDRLSASSLYRSKKTESSNSESVSASAGQGAVAGEYTVRTIQTAATHTVSSSKTFDSLTEALGLSGEITINPDGFVGESADLSALNNGLGVQPGSIRITDRSGQSAEIDLSKSRTIDDVLTAINDADIDVFATTSGDAIKLVDNTGSTASNLVVEQLGNAETAADLGLWGIDEAADSVVGNDIQLDDDVSSLRGSSLSDLGGGAGIGPLGDLDLTLSDGSTATVDLSAASTLSEVVDLVNGSGLDVIARLNDAENGLRIRDVSGGTGNLQIASTDSTATDLGIAADTSDDIVVGSNLNRQTVTSDTLLADLNQGDGPTRGSFTITDSDGVVSAINLATDEIESVGDLIDKINGLSADVTASLNETGDGIAVVDSAGGSGTLTITDTGNGTAAADLGIAGTAVDQTFGGATTSSILGSQAVSIQIDATDSLESIVDKINESGRYGEASAELLDDGSYTLKIRADKGGEQGRMAINAESLGLFLRTETRGQDAVIAFASESGSERFLTSTDGVFEINGETSGTVISGSTKLTDLNAGVGVTSGSFTVTDTAGKKSAINLRTDDLSTVGDLVDAFNKLNVGVEAKINDDGTGIAIVDTAGGDGTLTIEDVGNGTAAAKLGIAGEAETQTVDGQSVAALVGPNETLVDEESTGLTFTLKQLSDDPVVITVDDNPDSVVSAAETFVNQYNLMIDKINSLTFFDSDANEVGLLFGSSESLRITNGYSRLLSGRINGAGELKSIGEVGISFDDKGKLSINKSKLQDALAADSGAVEAFFATEENGLANRLSSLADRYAGEGSSTLLNKNATLGTQIERNDERVETLNSRLESERERLLKQYYATEQAISNLQSNQSFLGNIAPVG